MIKKLKKEIKYFIDKRVNKIIENQKQLGQTNLSYNQISKLFEAPNFIPFNSWSISPNTILHFLNDIVIYKRSSVIEFGAGVSTLYIAKLIKSQGLNTSFYSVESDQAWIKKLETQLLVLKLDDVVKIIYSPIGYVPKHLAFKDQKTWYDISILNNKIDESVRFDLIIVDGPVGANTPYSRYSAIPYLKNRINSDFSIFLDDINRSDELEIAKEWANMLECRSIFKDRYVNLTSKSNFESLPFQIG